MTMRPIMLFVAFAILSPLPALQAADPYGDLIRAAEPTGWWRFEQLEEGVVKNSAGPGLEAKPVGSPQFKQAGPRPSDYPDFSPENQAVKIPNGKNYFVVKDPGDNSPLDFQLGDGITLEAWVKIDEPLKGSYPYIIGKGRTHNPGFKQSNQSYSLRLATAGGKTAISFYFADESGAKGDIQASGHRWTSVDSVPADGYWHHVAVTYVFGEKDSLRGYIDGQPVKGTWDMAGATAAAPIQDNDELWIGSSMGGSATLGASLDEVALYRTALSPETIASHAKIDVKIELFAFDRIAEDAPTDHVRVELFENVSAPRKWTFAHKEFEQVYTTDQFALKELPRKYDSKGLIIDREPTMLLHLSSTIEFEGGDYEFILRSLDASRLYIDGQLVAETGLINLNSSAHQDYYRFPDHGDELLSVAAGQNEDRKTFTLSPGKHVVSLYRLYGNKGRGVYLGELTVGFAKQGEPFRFLAPVQQLPYTDEGWLTIRDEQFDRLNAWNRQQRLAASEAEREYWNRRHEWARTQVGQLIEAPQLADSTAINNNIDRFIIAGLRERQLEPTGEISDREFLRRVTLDITGRIPTPELTAEFFNLPVESRRGTIIDRLLDSPDWADHWVGYWQDVLAENPGLTKPELNNSGPFRWYLYEAFQDNKPFDRFVTELALLEGSAYSGGPAGFGIASQNDAPMAAKAHVIGTAFLAVEMKCARCHDAPYHDVLQKDLFSVAAMLKQGPQTVPGTSTVPVSSPEERENLAVKVTLLPGASVKPEWPFAQFVSLDNSGTAPLPAEFIRSEKDSRHQLAAMLTSPHNQRFTQVIVNRLWERYLGRGIISPVDDWEEATAAYPELLDYLAQEFILSGYDLKTLARLILNSHVYQRQPVVELTAESRGAELFRGPIRRKMTGEQLLDSLYTAAGKPFGSEELTIDLDGKMSDRTFGHLGIPTRAWQLVTVSNERDRPSMTLPVAQSLIDLMVSFGWRQQRQDPITHREDPITALQPMALANGISALRAIDFSDDSLFTHDALQDQPVEAFVEKLFDRLLTRTPTSDERELFSEMLREGYADRIIAGPEAIPPRRIFRTGITWISHFHPEADIEATRRMEAILDGDLKSTRLNPDWRERAEDAAWVLVNSPEFLIVP